MCPIRTGKLMRPCRQCGELFEPTGKASKLCEHCVYDNRYGRKRGFHYRKTTAKPKDL